MSSLSDKNIGKKTFPVAIENNTYLSSASSVTVFGGSGFVGRHVVQRLVKTGTNIRVIVRHPDEASYLKPMGNVGQIVPIGLDIRNQEGIAMAVEGADVVINLIGILFERKTQSFEALHTLAPGAIGNAAKAAGVKRLIHISALGVTPKSKSIYARSKANGEAALHKAFPDATILRPSVIFGPEDNFFNRLARLAKFSPVLLLPYRGATRLQPVYVGDVADAVIASVERKDLGGCILELGGPSIITMREILEYILAVTNRRRFLLPLPTQLVLWLGFFCQKFMSVPTMTDDQMRLLASDNVLTQDGVDGLATLGITPTPIEAIVPCYLIPHSVRERNKKLDLP